MKPKTAWQEHREQQAARIKQREQDRFDRERDRIEEIKMLRRRTQVYPTVSPYQSIVDKARERFERAFGSLRKYL